ncbi:hypothetical protein PVAG01_04550 [Phlyctema vagabunda]|uniref:non-specific serine/threonine protein kinase n=1 Tax=Phlyctema vagabunda TaxID=108571 RepID=A0ABR4PHI9_9HELO
MAESIDRPASPLRKPRKATYAAIDEDLLLEEETLGSYEADRYYPVHIGELFENRYQVIGKLGFGSQSTVWLCRDLVKHKYVTVKVYSTITTQGAQEERVYARLKSKVDLSETGTIRDLLDIFELPGAKGKHVCIVHKVLGTTAERLAELFPGRRMLHPLVLLAADSLIVDLSQLHDVQPSNVLLVHDKENDEFTKTFEQGERSHPSLRRVDSRNGRHIYSSRALGIPENLARYSLCDYGAAVFGQREYTHDAMPDLYRAPEIILRMPWNEKIDIWSLGLTLWTLYEGGPLFQDTKLGRNRSRTAHLARMIAVLGPPPDDLLQRGSCSKQFFDESGIFKGEEDIVPFSLEDEMLSLKGKEKSLFLAFLRRTLQWRPEDRPSAAQLRNDPFLQQLQ